MEPISRMALGRLAKLGDLFDGCSEQFYNTSVLVGDLPQSAISSQPNRHTNIDYIIKDSITEKCAKLDVDGELKASILCKLVKLEGHGAYLTGDRQSKRSAECSLSYKTNTVYERLNVWDSDLRKQFSTEAIDACPNATHIVVGIYWGSCCVVKLTHENSENGDRSKILGQLEGMLRSLKIGPEGRAELTRSASDVTLEHSVKYSVDADLQIDEIPQNIADVLRLINGIPNKIAQCHDHKGVPLKYDLFPLSILEGYLKNQMAPARILQNIDDAQIVRIGQCMDAIADSQRELQDIYNDFLKTRYLPDNVTFELCAKIRDVKNEVAQFQSTLGKRLKEYRESASIILNVDDLLADVDNSCAGQNAIRRCVTKYNVYKEKLAFLEEMQHMDVAIVIDYESLHKMQRRHRDVKLNVLFLKTDDEKRTDDCKHLFYAMCNDRDINPHEAFAIADLDVYPKFSTAEQIGEGTRICVFENGHYTATDLLQLYEDRSHFCYAKSPRIIQHERAPHRRIAVEVACPKSLEDGGCEKILQSWKCENCKNWLEYGFDSYFYCSCGRAPFATYTYRCKDRRHGWNFSTYDEEIITEIIHDWETTKEYNILVLGQTGVGKSTWLNALVNYMEHSTLEDALNFIPTVIIPSSFEITGCDRVQRTVTVEANDLFTIEHNENDNNEDLTQGKSSTQSARAYTFRLRDKIVRIIDTPGIGDPRGIDKDRENLTNTLSFLANVETIHGIVIMLKPNDSVLTLPFQYCIQELLTHLHRSAKDNLVFCFTNTRTSFYNPGNTLPPLRQMLKKISKKGVQIDLTHETMYCMDNEASCLLYAKLSGVPLDSDMVAAYSKSWIQSADESNRMFDYFFSKPPHNIKETLSLNEARAIMAHLSKPMTEIVAEIGRNLNLIKMQNEDLKALTQLRANADDVSRLKIKQIMITPIPLNHSRTVCANESCISFEPIAGSTETQTVYKTICHDRCDIAATVGEFPNPALKTCRAFKPQHFGGAIRSTHDNCFVCGCEWDKHLHINYEYRREEVEVDDGTISEHIAGHITTAEAIARKIQTCRDRKMLLESELARITTIAAFFASILKASSISPYNDAFEAYAKQLIKQETAKGHSAVVERLKRNLEDYDFQVTKMNEMTQTAEAALSKVTDIESCKQELFALPLYGYTFKRVFEINAETSRGSRAYAEHPVHVHRQKAELHSNAQKKRFKNFAWNAGSKAWSAGSKMLDLMSSSARRVPSNRGPLPIEDHGLQLEKRRHSEKDDQE